jgi:cysteinyl-tRNA synthetase
MIAMIERLIEGHAYEAEGHVLFSCRAIPIMAR